jgi:hypothetical protein
MYENLGYQKYYLRGKHERLSNSYPEGHAVKIVLFPKIGGSCKTQQW